MSVTRVDLRTKRHRANVKELLNQICTMIEELEGEVAGYAVVAWAEDGTAAMSYLTGGCVEAGGIPIYAHQKLNKLVEKTLESKVTYF